MNSIVTLELNNILTEYTRENTITGNPFLDQKIVTFIITLISTYTEMIISKIKIYLWNIYYKIFPKDDYLIVNKDQNNIVHVWISESTTSSLYLAINEIVPTMEQINSSNSILKNKKDTSFILRFNNDGTNISWKIENGGAKLPKDDEKSENSENYNIPIKKYFINFKNKEIMIALFYHKKVYNTYFWHLFMEKDDNIRELIKELMDEILKRYKNLNKNISSVRLFEIQNGRWNETITLNPKSVETVVGNNCRYILKDVNLFLKELGNLYNSLDIPYKRGYLLYGPPGTGKTSVVRAIASITRRNIYKITFNEINLGDEEYQQLLRETSSDSIILMDDIDPVLLQEGGYINKGISLNKEELNSEKKEIINKRVSYNTLLDALDGINSNTGRITFITTNHPDKMGKAILRPGRLDVKQKMDYAQDNEILEYFILFYKYFQVPEEEINKKVIKFITNLRKLKEGKNLTFAILQQYLIQYLGDIDKAIDGVGEIFNHNKIQSFI